jgi:cell division protein FtsI (penicillin-binding protein 3)
MKGFEETQRLAQSMIKKGRANKKRDDTKPVFLRGRFIFLSIALSILPVVIMARAAYIQIWTADFLRGEGDARSVRLSKLEASRGNITDRNGEELAISIPADSLWIDPVQLLTATEKHANLFSSPAWKQLSKMVGEKPSELSKWVQTRASKRFVYLKRQLTNRQSEIIKALKIPGVHLLSEPRRFYPAGEVAAHVTGFTNIDGKGLEGIERAFDQQLGGEKGQVLVHKDLLGNVIDRQQILKAPRNGSDVELSLDARIQTIAYLELKKTVERVKAKSATAVVMDVTTGEILAMVNQPSYNPNNRKRDDINAFRNRAVTDFFEPGSTLKPFTAVAALDSGKFNSNSVIDTQPMKVNGYWIGRDHNYGKISVSEIIKKSSNVGVTKMALALPTEDFISLFYDLGFGMDSGSGFPGESTGLFRERTRWSDIEKATLAYGYGISVTAMQLARAYSVLGAGGLIRPASFIRQNKVVEAERLFSKKIAQQTLLMMEEVLDDGGTGVKARVKGYRVAGKTGTSRKAIAGGYSDNYVAVFAGVAPITNPRLAVVVMIDDPRGDEYYGGEISAPIFAAIMERSLRWLEVAPDKDSSPRVATAEPKAQQKRGQL